MLHADSDLICDQPETTQKQRPEEEEAKQTNPPFFLKSLSRFVCLSALQFTVECEWQREESQTLSVAVPHVLSFGE